MANIDTFGPYGVGVVDCTPQDYKFKETQDLDSKDAIRIYMSDRLGRRSRQRKMTYDFSYGMMFLKRELALAGEVGIPEARLWGKVIHCVGTEDGLLTVHLRQRYAE